MPPEYPAIPHGAEVAQACNGEWIELHNFVARNGNPLLGFFRVSQVQGEPMFDKQERHFGLRPGAWRFNCAQPPHRAQAVAAGESFSKNSAAGSPTR